MMYGGFVRRFSGDRLGLAPPSVRSSAAVSLVGVLVLLGIGVVLARPARAMAPVATAKPVVLAVWAHVDDNMPVAGATVRVYATARSPASGSGQPPARLLVRQSSAPRTERTYGTGVALLEFTHLPRAFTVEVTGGQAGGRRLPGRFSVVVRNYLSGTVVDVNPVTTLITDDLAGQRELPAPIALARDHAQIYRLLGIPGWEDQVDLRYSTRYFDGASYLRAAQRAGGIRRLDRQLVAQARRGQQHRFLSAPATFTEGPRLAGPIASAAAAGAGLIAQAFKFLAAQAGSSLVRVAGQKAGTAALGWVLAAYGFEDALADQEVTEIRRIVEQLSTQVAQLQNQVSQLQRDLGVIGFSTLAHQTDRTIGQIDHATSQLALLANMPAKDSTKAAFAQTIADYIGTNLLDAPAILNRGLGSHLPLADNVIKSASRALAQRKFFGLQSSAEVRGVYDYFAAYQVQLAMLLQEYYHAKPTVYSAENNVANLAQLRGNVESQAGSLKPDVPADTVIDTKSSEMWVTDLPDPEKRLFDIAYATFGFQWRPNSSGTYTRDCGHRPWDGPRGLAGLPHCDWEMPTADAYRRLIEGWSGKSPSHWLHKEAGFSGRITSAFGYQKWVRDNYKIISPFFNTNEVFVDTFDLYHGRFDSHRLIWSPLGRWQPEFERVHAGLMYVRKLKPDESYWWSG